MLCSLATLLPILLPAAADGNRQNAFNPNGPGVTGWGDNWVEYAGEQQ
jgi:hypothetical protein